MVKHSIVWMVFLVSFSFSDDFARSTSTASQISITPAEPTHYFYTPMAKVNPPYHLVLSLHEISFSLPANLQLQASLFDNIGRINLGAKYGIAENLSVGAGLAHSLLHMGNGAHGIPVDPARFGAFLCYEFVKTPTVEVTVTPHTQLFAHNSIGCDLGGMNTPSDFWSIIWEVGTSLDLTDSPASFYFNTDGGDSHPSALNTIFKF